LELYGEEEEDIRALLLDETPLELRPITEDNNSMLLEVHLSTVRTPNSYVMPMTMPIQTIALVDSGCTAMGFADNEAIKQKYNIEAKQLARPRAVKLADGTAMGSITEYFTLQTTIGQHTEIILFFVTRLSRSTPLILGMPWLKKHNPHCDWPNMQLVFNSPYCRRHCLPWRSAPHAAPRGTPIPRTPLTVAAAKTQNQPNMRQ